MAFTFTLMRANSLPFIVTKCWDISRFRLTSGFPIYGNIFQLNEERERKKMKPSGRERGPTTTGGSDQVDFSAFFSWRKEKEIFFLGFMAKGTANRLPDLVLVVDCDFAAGMSPFTAPTSCEVLAENSSCWLERFLKKKIGQKLTKPPPIPKVSIVTSFLFSYLPSLFLLTWNQRWIGSFEGEGTSGLISTRTGEFCTSGTGTDHFHSGPNLHHKNYVLLFPSPFIATPPLSTLKICAARDYRSKRIRKSSRFAARGLGLETDRLLLRGWKAASWWACVFQKRSPWYAILSPAFQVKILVPVSLLTLASNKRR